MTKLQYTEEGLPYYQAGENEPTGDNPLYPTVNPVANGVQPQSFALPVETPPELAYDPWEAVAARIRARQPVRQASPEAVAASAAPIEEYAKALSGENRYQTWPEKMVRSAVTLPGQVYSGEVDPLSEEGIQRAQDVASLAGGAPLTMKAGTASLGSGMVRRMGTEMTTPTFFSTVENAIRNAKQNSATAEQWLGYLKNQSGIKQEELSFTNLESLPKGQITKQQLEQHIADNKVQLNDVWKGKIEKVINKDSKYAIPEVLRAAKEAGATPGDLELVIANDGNAYRALMKKFPELRDNEQWAELVTKNVFGSDTLPGGVTKFNRPDLVLPGGENYRELLLQLPSKKADVLPKDWSIKLEPDNNYYVYNSEGQMVAGGKTKAEATSNAMFESGEGSKRAEGFRPQEFRSSHWDEPNILAHIRMNDRDIPGVGNSLHIEEIQSDWHQKGRKEGYKQNVDMNEMSKLRDNSIRELLDLIDKNDRLGFDNKTQALRAIVKDSPPNMWEWNTPEELKLAEKHVADIKKYNDVIISSKSEVPNAPFKTSWADLALKRVIRQAAEENKDAVSWTPGEAQAARYDLSKQVSELRWNKTNNDLQAKDHSGKVVIREQVGPDKLADYVGKEAAEKLINSPTDKSPNKEIHFLSALDLKVGGEGMMKFYDDMLVAKANAIAKKYGGKVEQRNIKGDVQVIAGKGGYYVMQGDKEIGFYETKGHANEIANEIKETRQGIGDNNIHVLKLTPELKAKALKEGFPLFSAGVMPVDHKPEFEKQPKLTPIDYNPFAPKITPVDFNPFTNSNAT